MSNCESVMCDCLAKNIITNSVQKTNIEVLQDEINRLKIQLKCTEEDRDSKGLIATSFLGLCMMYAKDYPDNEEFCTRYKNVVASLGNAMHDSALNK